jgi:hypothetical protein
MLKVAGAVEEAEILLALLLAVFSSSVELQ